MRSRRWPEDKVLLCCTHLSNTSQTFMKLISNLHETDLTEFLLCHKLLWNRFAIFAWGSLFSRRAMIGVSSIQKNRIQLISLLKVWGLWKIGNDQCISIFLAPKLKFFTTTKKVHKTKENLKLIYNLTLQLAATLKLVSQLLAKPPLCSPPIAR